MTREEYCDRNICVSNEYNGIGCEECEVTKSQEPCEDAISRQALVEWMQDKTFGDIVVASEHNFDCLPPVTPKPKMGRWIFLDECTNSGYYCSECHKKLVKEGWSDTVKKIKFCPNCGAKMVESEEV